jgi:cobalamin biosynthesis Mg chelatase CobN
MRSRRYLDLLVYLAALVSTVAWARGIECAATRPSVGRVVCDRAFPSNQCDDIVAQPQALLGAAEPVARLAQSRQPRSACADIRWINTAFGQGEINSQAVGLNTAAAPAADMASIPEPAPDAAASSAAAVMPDGDSLSASATSPPSGVSQAHQSSEAGARLPQPAASNAVSTRATSSMNESSRGMGLTGLLTALIIIAIVLSAFIIRRNKALGITTDYRRAGGKKRR